MRFNFYWMSFLKSFLSPFLVLFFLLLLSNSAFSQTSIEEEIQVLKSSLQDKKEGDKVITLKDIAVKYRSVNVDSARHYVDRAFDAAKSMKSDHYQSIILMVYGILENDAGKPKEALAYHLRALAGLENSDDHTLLGNLYTNISNAYAGTSEFDKSVDFQFKALKNYEMAKDSLWIAGSYKNLGNRYKLIKEPDLSLEYYFKALDIYQRLGDKYYIAMCYNNLSAVYMDKLEYDKAVEYAQKSLEGYNEIGARLDAAYPLTNLGLSNWALKHLEASAKYYHQAIELQEERGERLAILFLKNDLSNVLFQQRKIQEAENLASATYQEAEKMNFLPAIDVLAKTLSEIFEGKQNFKEAQLYLKKHIAARDSLFFNEKAQEMLNLKEKYESEQKENEILRQKNELVANELTLKKRNDLLLAGGALMVLILVVAFALLREQKMKAERIKNEMALEQALVEVKAQENLKEQRIRIARDLHDNIGSQLTYITSITDTAIRNFDKGEVFMAEKLTQMKQFTLVTIAELRDTIWAMNKDEISLEDIQERTNQLAATVHDATDDAISVRTVGDTSDKMLSAFVGMNLFRIIQESINNAVKHSQTSEVLVTFKDTGSKVEIVVEDFGKGFDTKTQFAGNGLYIMKSRAEKAGVIFELSSEIGKGTKVELTVEA